MFKALFEAEYDYGNKKVISAGSLRYNVHLVAYTDCVGIKRQDVKSWYDLRFELLIKYQWLFRRWAALHQIENPRHVTGFYVTRYESQEEKASTEKKRIVNKIRDAKARITKANNELQKLRAGWKELFPIEDHPKYAATVNKIAEKQCRLQNLVEELNAMP